MSFASDNIVTAVFVGGAFVLASTALGLYFGWRTLDGGGFWYAFWCVLFFLPGALAVVVLWALLGGPTRRTERSTSRNREP